MRTRMLLPLHSNYYGATTRTNLTYIYKLPTPACRVPCRVVNGSRSSLPGSQTAAAAAVFILRSANIPLPVPGLPILAFSSPNIYGICYP